MSNTTNPTAPVTGNTITRTEVEAVRDYAFALPAERTGEALELISECDRALEEPFAGEEGWTGSLTRTAIRTRALAAKVLNELRAADLAEFTAAVSGQAEGER